MPGERKPRPTEFRQKESRTAVEKGARSEVDDESYMKRRAALKEELASVSDILDQCY